MGGHTSIERRRDVEERMSSRYLKVEGGCGRESHVDRNLRATTSEAGEGGNAVFALAAAQRICRSVQAAAAVRAPRLLMKLFSC